MFLSFEELQEDERPPKHIWLDGEKLREHMDNVRAAREERFDPDKREREIEDPVQNELTRGLKERLKRG